MISSCPNLWCRKSATSETQQAIRIIMANKLRSFKNHLRRKNCSIATLRYRL